MNLRTKEKGGGKLRSYLGGVGQGLRRGGHWDGPGEGEGGVGRVLGDDEGEGRGEEEGKGSEAVTVLEANRSMCEPREDDQGCSSRDVLGVPLLFFPSTYIFFVFFFFMFRDLFVCIGISCFVFFCMGGEGEKQSNEREGRSVDVCIERGRRDWR